MQVSPGTNGVIVLVVVESCSIETLRELRSVGTSALGACKLVHSLIDAGLSPPLFKQQFASNLQ